MIPLLLDENIPRPSIAWLIEQGYDVLSVGTARPGALDTDIAIGHTKPGE